MKIFKEVERRYKEKILDKLICDICRKRFDNEWDKKMYDIIETSLFLKEGIEYPEFVFYKTISFQICPECFKTKLIPFLEKFGAKPTEEEYSN